jgi:hypothetical protein
MYTQNNKLYGVVNGVIQGQNARVDELNQRIYDRFVPDANLEPNYDPRPVPTKYALFPVVDRRTPATVGIPQMPLYDTQTGPFAPFESRAPISGFLANVDVESKLRAQVHCLAKYGREDEYIPSSDSDLYKVAVPGGSDPSPQPFAGLFQRPVFDNQPGFVDPRIGQDRFFNHTRTQLRSLA